MATHRLTVEQARRAAVRAQRLDADRPTDLLPLVEHLTFLQLDPTAAVAPAAELVAWTRLGSSFDAAELVRAVDVDRTLYEHQAMHPNHAGVALVRPMADLPLYLEQLQAGHQHPKRGDWVAANDAFRRDVLARLRDDGPLLSRDVPDTAQVPWASSGWTGNQNVTQMLDSMRYRGEIAVAGRRGKQRLWDLAERVYPDVAAVPLEEAFAERDRRLLAALGVARAGYVGEAGEPAEVEGTKGEWRIDPALAARLDEPFAGRTALLSPFDRLTHDRVRAEELWGFEYILEMYKPAAKRRWGYFALPLLHHDRLVGKLDARADRKAGRFVVDAIHEEGRWNAGVRRDVRREIRALADWLRLDVDDRTSSAAR
jgi:uncharacterized protein